MPCPAGWVAIELESNHKGLRLLDAFVMTVMGGNGCASVHGSKSDHGRGQAMVPHNRPCYGSRGLFLPDSIEEDRDELPALAMFRGRSADAVDGVVLRSPLTIDSPAERRRTVPSRGQRSESACYLARRSGYSVGSARVPTVARRLCSLTFALHPQRVLQPCRLFLLSLSRICCPLSSTSCLASIV